MASQVSKPYLVALIALVAVAGVWFTVLKPKGATGTTAPPTAPGVVGLGNAVNKANGAVATSQTSADRSTAAANAAGGDTAATPAASAPGTTSATPAKPAQAVALTPADKALKGTVAGDPSRPLLRELTHHKIVVLLFWNPEGADDVAARDAVRQLRRRGGKVAVHVANLKRVGDYEAITRGLQVLVSPTVIVMNDDNKARVITGYTESRELDQLVGDAISKSVKTKKRAAKPSATKPSTTAAKPAGTVPNPKLTGFAAKVDAQCATTNAAIGRLAPATSPAQYQVALRKMSAQTTALSAAVAKLPAPAPWKGFQSWFVVSTKRWSGQVSAANARIDSGTSAVVVNRSLRTQLAESTGPAKARFERLGLNACAA